jgi:hypothetical protein
MMRIEQLTQEKEQLDWDRKLAQASSNRTDRARGREKEIADAAQISAALNVCDEAAAQPEEAHHSTGTSDSPLRQLSERVATMNDSITHASDTALQPFPLYPALPKFRSLPEGSSADDSAERETIIYCTPEQRAALTVHVRDGLLVDRSGKLLDPETTARLAIGPATDAAQPLPRRDGLAMFVLAADGTLLVNFDHNQPNVFHSSLADAQPIAAAGEVVIRRGELRAASNASGHYRPPACCLEVLLCHLTTLGAQGIDRVRLVGTNSSSPTPSLSSFWTGMASAPQPPSALRPSSGQMSAAGRSDGGATSVTSVTSAASELNAIWNNTPAKGRH